MLFGWADKTLIPTLRYFENRTGNIHEIINYIAEDRKY